MRKSASTRACILQRSIKRQRSYLWIDGKSGLSTMIGKVNMDRNSPDYLRELSAEESEEATREWLKMATDKNYDHTRPILTPRFIPSCTDELMERLKGVQGDFGLPVQSHLSENQGRSPG